MKNLKKEVLKILTDRESKLKRDKKYHTESLEKVKIELAATQRCIEQIKEK